MKVLLKPAAFTILLITAFSLMALINPPQKNINSPVSGTMNQKIQVAILLDVSNSMDGLIEQAKLQLWNMVSTMGKAKCTNGKAPDIEIALYEYGRTTNAVKDGYVKQISPFTRDLDKLSQQLFNLTTMGGDEYCGQVIYTSLNQLDWDANPNNYKVIFIAGNEDFLQGNLHYTKSCTEAKNKGVIVNTIYCGNRLDGIREHWNLGAECGNGSFTNINQDAKIEDIPTPYDSLLFSMNDKLNGTYIAYGNAGAGKLAMQSQVDQMNYSKNKNAAAKRVGVKGNNNLYKNESWDLVDRDETEKNDEYLTKLDKKSLPAALQNKSTAELKKIITEKKTERGTIQKQIETINTQREVFIAAERKKNASNNVNATLETEVEKMIKEQAKRYKMIIE